MNLTSLKVVYTFFDCNTDWKLKMDSDLEKIGFLISSIFFMKSCKSANLLISTNIHTNKISIKLFHTRIMSYICTHTYVRLYP